MRDVHYTLSLGVPGLQLIPSVSYAIVYKSKIPHCNNHLAGLKGAKYDFIIPSLSETARTE